MTTEAIAVFLGRRPPGNNNDKEKTNGEICGDAAREHANS
jgi:hypothetical protein